MIPQSVLESGISYMGDWAFVPFDQARAYIYVMLGNVVVPELITTGLDQNDVTILHTIYTLLATLMLQSLIVAMMGNTYARESEHQGLAMWWMNHASVVLRYERNLREKKRQKYRFGTDNSPGSDHPACRPFFNVVVGHDNDTADSLSKVKKHITTQDMLKNVNGSFAQLDSNIELLHESMHSDLNVRYSRLDAKLNSIWKKLPSDDVPTDVKDTQEAEGGRERSKFTSQGLKQKGIRHDAASSNITQVGKSPSSRLKPLPRISKP
jgi:hypothetical protein